MTGPLFKWTDECLQDLRDGWDKGKTVAMLAHEIGCSKGAISGQVTRLKLTPRGSPIKRAAGLEPVIAAAAAERAVACLPAAERLVEPAPAAAPPPPPPPELALPPLLAPQPAPPVLRPPHRPPAPPPQLVPPIDAEPRRPPACRWPLGDPGTPGFRFCNALRPLGVPYCDEHFRLSRRGRHTEEDA